MATTRLNRPTACAAAGRAPGLWRAWIIAYAVIWTFTLAAAVLVRVLPGGPALARQLLALKLSAAHNPPPNARLVLSIALNNTLRAIWPLMLGLIGAQRHRLGRILADAAVTANLLVPGLLVGAALAGYGTRVVPYLPHTPVEWAGITASASGWLARRRRRPQTVTRLEPAVASTIALLVCAAVIEVHCTPHR